MAHRTHGGSNRQAQSIAERFRRGSALPFADLLDAQRVLAVLHDEGVWFRECVFTPLLTLWTFLSQVLSADQSCRNAVSRARAFLVALGKKPCEPDTGPYCKARQRLPEQVVSRLAREVAAEVHQRRPGNSLLGGRPIKIVDGTTVSMPDTPDNQAEYPQPTSQAPGLGFPLARLVAVLCLSCGVTLDIALGRYKGKQTGETALFRTLWEALEPGDVVLADRYYASYWMIALLLERGIDSVFRMHQLRKYDFRKGRRLGPDDHTVTWSKPAQRPKWMDPATYRRLPDYIRVRELRIRVRRPGWRVRQLVIVTTLLDADEVPKEELERVYRARWHAELDLRSIKKTMQMDVLRCRTPEMVRKEIWAHVLAYNLIRAVMVEAAEAHELEPRELSFKGALQALAAFRDVLALRGARCAASCYAELLQWIASHRVGDRPNRCEPRAVKRRVHTLPTLKEPRAIARSRLLKTY